MPRTASPALSAHVAKVHRAAGVELRLGAGIARIATDGSGRIAGVETSDGGRIDADLVLVGIGLYTGLVPGGEAEFDPMQMYE